jgi:glycosyltransferase involved in cell wall biosynthesis
MLAYAYYEIDNRIRRYAEALVNRGDDVEAIALSRQSQAAAETIKGVRVSRIQKRSRDERGPLSHLWRLLLFFVRSSCVLTVRHLRKPYDVIHVHSVPDFEVFATLIPRLLGARVILDIHDIVPEFYASKFGVSNKSIIFRLLLLTEKLAARYSDHVIISNDLWYRKLTARSVGSAKCTSIINYPDQSIFWPRPRTTSTNEFVLCYPGTLNRHQGVDLAVEAVQLLKSKLPQLRFWIVGDGPDKPMLERLVRHEELDAVVKVRGSVPLEKVAETMSVVDVGVVPKRNSSFGNEAFSTKILEFMSMGVPVVAARTAIDQHYFNDDLVQFFEPNNVDDLATKIAELASDPRRRAELRENGLEFVRSNNWQVKQGEYLRLVDALAKSTSIRGARKQLEPPATVRFCKPDNEAFAQSESIIHVTSEPLNLVSRLEQTENETAKLTGS